MKLIDLLNVTQTYYFKIRAKKGKEVFIETIFGNLTITQQHDLENDEVIDVDVTSEVFNESPISKAREIRPLLLVTTRREEQ